MVRPVVNVALFQAGWFACVLGAAHGHALVGPAVVAVAVAVALAMSPDRVAEARLFAAAAVLGYLADSALVLAGVVRFGEQAAVGWPSPLWMVAMWVNLATTLRVSMAWLRGRYVLAAALGAAGAPAAYSAGVGVGAATFGLAAPVALCVIGLVWVAAMPALVWLSGWGPGGRTAGDASARADATGGRP